MWPSHSQRPSEQISESVAMFLPILQLSCRLSGKTLHHPGLSAPLQPRFDSLQLLGFPKAKIAIGSEEICKCDGHTVHKLSQWSLTADWLAPWESDCLRMRNKVSTDWLPSYITATQPVLEIFKMAGYFLDRLHMYLIFCYILSWHFLYQTGFLSFMVLRNVWGINK